MFQLFGGYPHWLPCWFPQLDPYLTQPQTEHFPRNSQLFRIHGLGFTVSQRVHPKAVGTSRRFGCEWQLLFLSSSSSSFLGVEVQMFVIHFQQIGCQSLVVAQNSCSLFSIHLSISKVCFPVMYPSKNHSYFVWNLCALEIINHSVPSAVCAHTLSTFRCSFRKKALSKSGNCLAASIFVAHRILSVCSAGRKQIAAILRPFPDIPFSNNTKAAFLTCPLFSD